MRKLLTIFLAFVYLVTTSGIVISTHYCMGEVKGHAFGQNNDHLCNTCGMTNEGCCHDDLSILKVNDDHQQVYTGIVLPSWDLYPVHADIIDSYRLPTFKNIDFAQGPAPPAYKLDRQAMFCVFRI